MGVSFSSTPAWASDCQGGLGTLSGPPLTHTCHQALEYRGDRGIHGAITQGYHITVISYFQAVIVRGKQSRDVMKNSWVGG